MKMNIFGPDIIVDVRAGKISMFEEIVIKDR